MSQLAGHFEEIGLVDALLLAAGAQVLVLGRLDLPQHVRLQALVRLRMGQSL